jgi:hypothetical protein
MESLNYAQEYDRISGEARRRQQARVRPFPCHVASPIRVSRVSAPNPPDLVDLFETRQKLSLEVGGLLTENRKIRALLSRGAPPTVEPSLTQVRSADARRNELSRELEEESRYLQTRIALLKSTSSTRGIRQLRNEFLEHQFALLQVSSKCRELQGQINDLEIEIEACSETWQLERSTRRTSERISSTRWRSIHG